jgi:hypothetical protein
MTAPVLAARVILVSLPAAAELQPWKAWKPGEKSFAYRGNYDRLTR